MNTPIKQDVGLDLFAIIWNQIQDQNTPPIHLNILNWLAQSWSKNHHQLLLMAFRSCGKSTLVGMYCAWLLYRNPNLRIMVIAADSILARKMVRNVKRIIERHPLTSNLRPERIDQWASDRFTIRRDMELRDPSMLARGVTSNITGSRADIIIYDDVEVPNTAMTAEKRNELRERLTESRFILGTNGVQLYVGTPHVFDTIYSVDQALQKPDQGDPFLNGFKDLRIPIRDKDGNSQWSEKITNADIDALERQVGPNKFASQMMLRPVNIAEGRLDVSGLTFYNNALDYREAQQKPILHLNDKKLVSCSAWWDPAFGTARGDASVLAIVFTDENGQYYLHHLDYIRVKINSDDDEASQQCIQIALACKRFYVPSITVEINGIGRFLPAILKRKMREFHVPCSVVEHSSHIPKSTRILEGFDAVLAARALNVHRSICKTPFLEEMREWKPSIKNGKDDGLDAVAGALSQEPIRVGGGVGKRQIKRLDWQGSGQPFKAKF